jgi:hypothetical protein
MASRRSRTESFLQLGRRTNWQTAQLASTGIVYSLVSLRQQSFTLSGESKNYICYLQQAQVQFSSLVSRQHRKFLLFTLSSIQSGESVNGGTLTMNNISYKVSWTRFRHRDFRRNGSRQNVPIRRGSPGRPIQGQTCKTTKQHTIFQCNR